MTEATCLDERELSRLRWRCRRGLLENDLFIERFFNRHASRLTTTQARALDALMALPEHDLLELLLGRRPPQGVVDTPEVREVLGMLREGGGNATFHVQPPATAEPST